MHQTSKRSPRVWHQTHIKVNRHHHFFFHGAFVLGKASKKTNSVVCRYRTSCPLPHWCCHSYVISISCSLMKTWQFISRNSDCCWLEPLPSLWALNLVLNVDKNPCDFLSGPFDDTSVRHLSRGRRLITARCSELINTAASQFRQHMLSSQLALSHLIS